MPNSKFDSFMTLQVIFLLALINTIKTPPASSQNSLMSFKTHRFPRSFHTKQGLVESESFPYSTICLVNLQITACLPGPSCYGTLIKPQWIISSSICVLCYDKFNVDYVKVPVKVNGLKRYDKYMINKILTPTQSKDTILQCYQNQSVSANYMENDIGLIQLYDDVELSLKFLYPLLAKEECLTSCKFPVRSVDVDVTVRSCLEVKNRLGCVKNPCRKYLISNGDNGSLPSPGTPMFCCYNNLVAIFSVVTFDNELLWTILTKDIVHWIEEAVKDNGLKHSNGMHHKYVRKNVDVEVKDIAGCARRLKTSIVIIFVFPGIGFGK